MASRRNAWLITFADLAALLVTFFIMLFSMSTVQMARWNEITDELSRYLNPALKSESAGAGTMIELPVIGAEEGTSLGYLMSVLDVQMRDDPVLGETLIRRERDRLIVTFPERLLFAPGATHLTQAGRNALHQLGGSLRNIRNQVDVAGHADPDEAADLEGAGWTFSLSRAQAVARALNLGGYRAAIQAFGYADSQFNELPTNMSPARRARLARRVDVILRSTVPRIR